MRLFIDHIEFQQQPNSITCVSTCLAMILSEDVQKIVSEFHDKYYNLSDERLLVTDFLKNKSVPFTLCNFESLPKEDGVYFVTVPSLNIKAGTHQILWCIQSAEKEGYFYQRILDPCAGRDGKMYYTDIKELLDSDPLATKIAGYGLDLHIPKEFFIK